jgi:hypothetical protein
MKHLKRFEEHQIITHFSTEESEKLCMDLYNAVEKKKYFDVVDLLKKGVDPNVTSEYSSKFGPYTYNLLMNAGDNLKIIKELLKYGADPYFVDPHGDPNFDYFEWVQKIESQSANEIYKLIKKYHPNFDEEREIKKSANQYNL